MHQSELIKAVEYIEESLSVGRSYSEMSKGLEIEFGTRFGTLRNTFNATMPYTLSKYIRRRALTEAYRRYEKEQPQLSTRSTYCEIKRFIEKFREEFGPLTSHYTEGDLQPKLCVDEIVQCCEVLEGLGPIVRGYKLEGDHVILDVDREKLLMMLLGLDSYFLPADQLDEFDKLPPYEQIASLVVEKLCLTASDPSEEILLDDAGRAYDTWFCYYDPEYRAGYGRYAVFPPIMPGWAERVFYESCDRIMRYVYIPDEICSIGYDWDHELMAISEKVSFEAIAERLDITAEKAKETVWERLRLGMLRVRVKYE